MLCYWEVLFPLPFLFAVSSAFPAGFHVILLMRFFIVYFLILTFSSCRIGATAVEIGRHCPYQLVIAEGVCSGGSLTDMVHFTACRKHRVIVVRDENG